MASTVIRSGVPFIHPFLSAVPIEATQSLTLDLICDLKREEDRLRIPSPCCTIRSPFLLQDIEYLNLGPDDRFHSYHLISQSPSSLSHIRVTTMRTSTIIFSVVCSFILLVALVPETQAGHAILDMMDNKGLKKKVLKKLVYYYMIAGNKKIYAVPFPLPLPIP